MNRLLLAAFLFTAATLTNIAEAQGMLMPGMLMPGMYNLVNTDGEDIGTFEFQDQESDLIGGMLEYKLEIAKVENTGFYIDYHITNFEGYPEGGRMGQTMSSTLDVTDKSFIYTDALVNDNKDVPIVLGDFDYLEDVTFRIIYNNAGNFLTIYGIGCYANGELPDENIVVSVALPGGTIGYPVLNKTLTLYFHADEGWEVSTVMIGDQNVTSLIDENGKLTMPVEESTSMSVTYIQLDTDFKRDIQTNNIKVYGLEGSIHIEAPDSSPAIIYDANGRTIYSGCDKTIAVGAGVYIVNIGSNIYKLAIK